MSRHRLSSVSLAAKLRHRPWLIVTGLIASAAIVTGTVLLPARLVAAPPAAAAPQPAPKVTVAPVEQQLVTDYEELTGHVDALETVELRARVSGHLETVHFAAGQLVAKGDVLFTIDPRWYQAQFDLASARATLAESEARRATELLQAHALSAEEAEGRQARAAEARAALATARLDLEHTQVRAPIAGRIGRAFVTPGNLVSGNPGGATLLATIVATGDAYVYADVDEATLLKFNRLARENRLLTRNGRIPVALQLADETGFPREGYIESADNRMNPATGSLVLRMIFPNADQALVPGLFARVRIPIGAPQPALLVSERAIGTDQSQKFVFAVDRNHTVAYRTVKLGPALDGKRVVREGVQAGDTVIVNGLQRVRPGMTVDPEPPALAGAPSGRVAVAALR
ncbi:MAG: efflux RND transporter periplasmic adaptor subunit [Opitutaceae bacterium]